jgi:hypothetical protein
MATLQTYHSKVNYGRNDSLLQIIKGVSLLHFRDNGDEEVEFMIKDNRLSSFKKLTEIEVQFIKQNLIK